MTTIPENSPAKPADPAVNFPFPPARWPFFYGWVILVAGIIGTLASIPGQTMAVGVFKESFIETLGLPELRLSAAYMVGTIASAFLLPVAGRLLDRFGARRFVVWSAIGLGASLVLIAQVDLLVRLAAMLLPAAAAPFLVLSVCYLLLRFFGQGCLTIVSRFVLGKWFHHRRGLAAGITGLFVSFGFSAAPGFINDILQAHGWRATLLYFALTCGVGMALFGWLFFRDNPEECGLTPDGVNDPAKLEKMRSKTPEVHREMTRGEALRTLAFWVFSAATGLQALVFTAIVFHIAAIGEYQGVSRDVAYHFFLWIAAVSVPSNFIAAWASDRIRLNWLLFLMMAMQGLGLVGILELATPLGPWLFTGGMGIAGGIFGMLLTVAWPRYFGTEHLGAISGLNMSLIVFASAIGPVLFSAGQRITGSYEMVTLLCILGPVAVLALSIFMENPQRRYARLDPDDAGR